MSLEDLLKRVESAKTPERELDAQLWGLIDDRQLEECGDGPAIWKRCRHDRIAFEGPRPYTSSLDAALALVEEKLPGWTIARISQADDKSWFAELREGHLTSFNRVAMSDTRRSKPSLPQLALISALLRALISQTSAPKADVGGEA